MTRKLVEVALPLEAISAASKRDKDKKTGTIKNVHKWFAPMPTPAWRALLFATLVDDPGTDEERAELLRFVERLVPDHGGAPDEATLAEARERLKEATGGDPPTVFDPFCGGGSTLVEAQRLGLPAAGSDLNPVPVLITRVLTELVPKVAGRPPLVGDVSQLGRIAGGPLDGFLADCRHYAERVREKVWDEVGHMYPQAPGAATATAWRWARTVECPNPACRTRTPLVTSFWLTKVRTSPAFLEVANVVRGDRVELAIRTGPGTPRRSTIGRTAARCLACDEAIPLAHVRREGQAGRLGLQLLAVAIDGDAGRSYLSAKDGGSTAPNVAAPEGASDLEMPEHGLGFRVQPYGIKNFADLYTNRQLAVLAALADAVSDVRTWIEEDGGDQNHVAAVTSVLGLCVSKFAMNDSSQTRWYIDSRNGSAQALPAFGRYALPMVWDFVEQNPFSDRGANWLGMLESVSGGLRSLPLPADAAETRCLDVRAAAGQASGVLVATDPPYFGQVGYADLSDYFYAWLRRALMAVHPDLFRTVATPKAEELIADPSRHGGSEGEAARYFVEGFTESFRLLSTASNPDLPLLIVYAHRQEETDEGDLSSTAWDAMLTAIIRADLLVVGTWPVHATHSSRQRSIGSNALASYVILVCRPQAAGAQIVDRQRFVSALRAELPKAIRQLQEGAMSTIDLRQATIGPGMAIFSRFGKVVEPDGSQMTARSAQKLIGDVLGEVLDEFVGDLDPWTRWAMVWYRDHGFDEGPFDDAEKLAKTTNTSLDGLREAGIAFARGGRARLYRRDEVPDDWSPDDDTRVTIWEVTEHLVKRLTAGGGEQAAADLLRHSRQWAEEARNLAYWLSQAAATKQRPDDLLAFDALVTSWPELTRLAEAEPEGQASLLQ